MRRAVSTLVGLGLGGGFYLLLIDTVSAPELYAGAGATLLGFAGYQVSREQGLAEASFSPAWLLRSVRILARVPIAIAVVSREAIAQLFSLRRQRGAFRTIRFDGGGETPREVGRRALVEAIGSVAPTTIVVGIDADRGLLLVHELGGPSRLDALELE